MIGYLKRLPIGQFIKYAAVGAIGTAVQYLLLWFLVEFAHFNSVQGSTCGFVTGAVTNYYANYHITFKSRKDHQTALPQFLSIAMAGLVINTSVMALGSKLLDLHYIFIQLFATGLVLILTFLGNKYWTFKQS